MIGSKGTWAVGLVFGLVAGATSCLGANAEHCVYAGGDLACGGGICVLAPRGGQASGVGDDGCFDGTEAPDGFIHAEYGLPARLEAEGDPMDLASVEGLLRRLVDGERSVGESDLALFRGAVFDDVARVRSIFTKDGGASEAERHLIDEQQRAIDVYYDAIRDWLGEAPPGTGTETDPGTTGSETEGTTATSTGETSSPECVGDAECLDEGMPFCNGAGQCVSCGEMPDPDGACAGADPGVPLCVGGQCVQCTAENPAVCEAALLLCDADANACVQCSEHEECGSGACELAVGTCFPAGTVVHVDGDGGQDFMSIAAAVGSVGEGMHGVVVVHEQDSGLGYPGVLIDGGRIIALLAAPDEAAIVQGTGGNPGLRVEGAGTILYMEGLEVSLAAMSAVGLRVDGALSWVDRSRIVQNSGGGVVAQNGAELTLRSCFVGSLGDVVGIDIIDASATVLYSTVTASTFMSTPALSCTTPVAVEIRNSIVVSQGGTSPDELACAAGSVENTATEADVGNFAIGWFVNYNAGDFSLSAMGATTFADIAVWEAGDPITDIDGDPRPTVDGSSDYAGADVP